MGKVYKARGKLSTFPTPYRVLSILLVALALCKTGDYATKVPLLQLDKGAFGVLVGLNRKHCKNIQ